MIRIVLFFFASSLTIQAYSQAKPGGAKDSKLPTSQQLSSAPTTGQPTPILPTNTILPVGKCCKVDIAYPPTVNGSTLVPSKTSSINNVIPGFTAADCAKNSCKIEVVDGNGKAVLKGWNVILDKTNNPTIDFKTLPKGKYKIRFVSGTKQGEKSIDI